MTPGFKDATAQRTEPISSTPLCFIMLICCFKVLLGYGRRWMSRKYPACEPQPPQAQSRSGRCHMFQRYTILPGSYLQHNWMQCQGSGSTNTICRCSFHNQSYRRPYSLSVLSGSLSKLYARGLTGVALAGDVIENGPLRSGEDEAFLSDPVAPTAA